MKKKNPLMLLFPLEKTENVRESFLTIGRIISKIFFSLEYDLKKAGLKVEAKKYAFASFISAMIYGIVFLLIGMVFGVMITGELGAGTIGIMLAMSIAAFFSALVFHSFYPKILSKQIASEVDNELLFALRTLQIQLSSGVSLFEAIKLISKSDFGEVSNEFSQVIKDINSGSSETKALEKIAFRTESELMKKTIWQIISTLKSGGALLNSLDSIIEELVAKQKQTIENYSATLNIWTLVYLIIAAAMPSLGVTFLVIASSIGGAGIGIEAVSLIVVLAFSIQAGLILAVRSQIPKVIK